MGDKMNKNIKKILIIILVIILAIILYAVINKAYTAKIKEKVNDVSWLRKNVKISEDYSIGSSILSVNKISDIDVYSDAYQKVINEKIEELKDKTYDFEDPLLIYNAYGTNKSGINMYFNTNEESYVTYTITAEDKDIKDYTKTLYNGGENNLTKNHEYQITGLVAGEMQTIKFKLYNKDNKVIETNTINVFMPETSVDIKLDVKNGKSKS